MRPEREAAAIAAEREAAAHGCCCKCCTLKLEIWACMAIDVTSVLGLAAEIPGWSEVPVELHAVDLYKGYLVFSVFSACLILYALREGAHAAEPRRTLVRFMSLKLPIFLVFIMGYFTVSPWAAPLAKFICRNDFESMRTTVGGDYDTCVSLFPWLTTANNAVYIFAYAFSFKAAREWFRCHPENDDKGIWWPTRAASGSAAATDGDSDRYMRLV